MTIVKKRGVKTSSGGHQNYIVKTHFEHPYPELTVHLKQRNIIPSDDSIMYAQL